MRGKKKYTLASDKVKSRELSSPGIRLILTSVAAGCAAVLLSLPQGVLPLSGPTLRFDPGAASAARRASAQAAEAATGWETDSPLWGLYEAQGLAEVGEGESEEEFETRGRSIQATVAQVRAEGGDEVIASLRAQVVEGLDGALRGERDDEGGFLGSFPRMLERYGAMQDGERVAPDIVLRALFAARFNGIVGAELTDGLSDVELQGYWGWLALGATDVPRERRAQALGAYVEAGGLDGNEAMAWFAYEDRDYANAARFYGRGGDDGNLRLRNHAIACQGMVE